MPTASAASNSGALLSLGAPEPLSRSLWTAEGGFAWWYLDLLNDRGDGLVLIWSFGLPFLPGYQGAARRGEAPPASARPSLNIALYREGREVLYLLQEYSPERCEWSADGESWRFDASTFESRERDGRRLVRASIDCALPASDERLRGVVELEGVARSARVSRFAEASPHDWSPLTGPARGRANLSIGRRPFEVEGRAYHDRNGSAVHLDGLGIEHWIWGRVPEAGRERVFYLLFPRDRASPPLAIGLTIDERGRTTEHRLEVALEDRAIGTYGMPFWRRTRLFADDALWADIHFERCLDDGPFYLRFETRSGARRGTGELCRPGRVDRALWRPFVRMRVDGREGDRSRFLPLFSGPRRGRVGRTLASLVGPLSLPERVRARLP